MRLTSYTDVLALFVLLAGVATASPIPFGSYNRQRAATTSPHIFCVTWNDRRLCEKFELPIVRRQSTSSLPHNAYSGTIIGSGQLVSEEDRQIRRIMDVKGDAEVVTTRQPWLIPDVQVVLWFVLLCCLTEGIVSGFRWWRTPRRGQGDDGKRHGMRRKASLANISESDEDDEANIPVL